jgi:hypothetical protein
LSQAPAREHVPTSHPTAISSTPGDFARSRVRGDTLFVCLLCAFAAIRVFFGAAALPFFADTDENSHFDLVHKLARGQWPGGRLALLDPETTRDLETIGLAVYYGSPEFVIPRENYEDKKYPPPVGDWPKGDRKTGYVEGMTEYYLKHPNHEVHEPPVYYALAAVWYRAGRLFGISPAAGVYWIRFLNAPLYAALVALSYRFGRAYFGHETGLAVAALTAFFPNTVFFTISNDVLSPLVGVLALGLTLRWLDEERPSAALSAAIGTVAAAAVLIKLTNMAIIGLIAVALLIRVRRSGSASAAVKASWPLLASAMLPLLLWGCRNRLVLGDWTGTAGKAASETWTPKPFLLWFDHPLFTFEGSSGYLKKLCVSFFSGDVTWNGAPVHFEVGEVLLLVATAVLPAVGFAATVRSSHTRLAALLSGLLVVAYVAEMAVISLPWDFGLCQYPSRTFPFFAMGRYAMGCLVPFLCLFVAGLGVLLGRWRVLFAVAVTAVVVLMAGMQWTFVRMTISSQYNWFHLP